MWLDPFVAEIRQIREEISASYGDDLHAIFIAAQRGDLSKNVAIYDGIHAESTMESAHSRSSSSQTAS